MGSVPVNEALEQWLNFQSSSDPSAQWAVIPPARDVVLSGGPSANGCPQPTVLRSWKDPDVT